ncbi:MAG: hypothetical protein FP814_07780 [Desulfobacterium sp.]|nr:hypothetical protein [Desulfobacterium sp.]MBU3949872.1 hypothetical protein [Pseudomonadota bacterium]MBU4009811.1 hypothetical protein [Pseudomonadota bacterium]
MKYVTIESLVIAWCERANAFTADSEQLFAEGLIEESGILFGRSGGVKYCIEDLISFIDHSQKQVYAAVEALPSLKERCRQNNLDQYDGRNGTRNQSKKLEKHQEDLISTNSEG